MTVEPGTAGLETARGLFLEAVAAHERREFLRAAELLQQALAIVPDRPSVLANLGAALLELGRTEEALVHITRSQVIERGDAGAHAEHGLALRRAGRREEARASLERAIALDPGCMPALVNHAGMLLEQGNAADALAGLDRALAVDPGNAFAWINRGIALDKLGRHEEALTAYDRALGLHPGHAGAWNNRGNTLVRLHRHEEALSAFDTALEIEPRHVEAWSNRGLALSGLGRHKEALESNDKALAILPGAASAWSNRGLTLSALKRDEEALACFDKAVDAQPGLAEAWSNKGRVLTSMARMDDAMAAFDKARGIDPRFADAWMNRGNALIQLKRYDEAMECYERALSIAPGTDHALGGSIQSRQMLCHWSGLGERLQQAELAIEAGKKAMIPFPALAVAFPLETQRRCAEICVAANYPPVAGWSNTSGPAEGRLRIGYLSADFRDHPVGYQLLALAGRRDRSAFELVGFSLRRRKSDQYAESLHRAFDRIHELDGLDPQVAIELLRSERLDIAVDLTGHTDGSRLDLFAGRIAPVQANFLCPGTSGAPYIDYIVADAVTIPEVHRAGYTEQVVRLPGSFFVTDYRGIALATGQSREGEGLPEDGLVFASFCESYKITPQVWEVWMRLLRQVTGSVLWLGIRSNAQALENLRTEARGHGVDPGRIVVASFAPTRKDHLSRLALADLCLDTLVYNGHTTSADALWAGVPVLTAPGGYFCGRVAASILHAAGMPELVARDLADYESIALRLASSPAELAALRERLARTKHEMPLFDTERSVRNVETAFRMMVERHRKGLPPESFTVPAG